MDLIELNEAFAAQALAVTREWKLTSADFDRVNVNGSGISLGHPVGATGGRILASLAQEIQRRQVRYGLETMCTGEGRAWRRYSSEPLDQVMRGVAAAPRRRRSGWP